MLASIACTGWFFYIWLGGVPGIVGACVGCAVQLMAYGFSAVTVHHTNGIMRSVLVLLIASALSLSVLSSYATLTGYFSAMQQEGIARETAAKQKERVINAAIEKRLQLMESMSRDVAIGSEAANQGISEKYRTQAKQFLSNNADTREEMDAQIAKFESIIDSGLLEKQETQAGSPIDGLSQVLGGQELTIMVLCLWLAIMFDALPLAGITLLEARAKKRKSLEKTNASAEASEPMEAPAQAQELSGITEQPAVIEASEEAAANNQGSNELIQHENAEADPRVFTHICSANLPASRDFYVNLLGFDVKFENDWYIHFSSPLDPRAEFGVIQRNHEFVPFEYQRDPNGMLLTFLVDDVDHTYQRAVSMGLAILQEPRNESYGQRRFLVKEFSGCLIDIRSPWEGEAA
ncbi:Catechol 2,3-dioxygenase [Alteromonadaceae bacterium Bs31]|nr:Catechol 2,3-dioxygenase [Alteromonadaceae bacterium Bs31]